MIYAKVRLESLRNAVRMLEEKQLPVRKWLVETEDGIGEQNADGETVEDDQNYCARDPDRVGTRDCISEWCIRREDCARDRT